MSAESREALTALGRGETVELRRSQCTARKRHACVYDAGHAGDHYNALDKQWTQEVSSDAERDKLYAHVERVRALLQRITYPDNGWRVGVMGDSAFIQITYEEADVDTDARTYSAPAPRVPQHGRKWPISQHATNSEIFQTALKAAVTSAEHRVREHFLVDGIRVFGPHLDIEAMLAFARMNLPAVRK